MDKRERRYLRFINDINKGIKMIKEELEKDQSEDVKRERILILNGLILRKNTRIENRYFKKGQGNIFSKICGQIFFENQKIISENEINQKYGRETQKILKEYKI
jgi:hypothetical protein